MLMFTCLDTVSGKGVSPTKYLQALRCHCALHNLKAFSNELVEYKYLVCCKDDCASLKELVEQEAV